MDKIFKELMATLSVIHDKPLTDSLISIYWAVLKEYEIDELKKGFRRAVEECKFFPKPSDLVELMNESVSDRALIAFNKLKNAIEDHGHTTSVAFDDPAIHSVVEEMGGWLDICSWLRDELPFKRQEFERWYKICIRRENHPAYLPGSYEAENRAWLDDPTRGAIVQKNLAIRFIGNSRKALEQYQRTQAKILPQPTEVEQIIGGFLEKFKI